MIMITVNFIEVRVGSRSLIKSRLFESVTVTVLAVAATVWCVSDWQHPTGGPQCRGGPVVRVGSPTAGGETFSVHNFKFQSQSVRGRVSLSRPGLPGQGSTE